MARKITESMAAHPKGGSSAFNWDDYIEHDEKPAGDRTEMQDMLAEVDLLGLIRTDTGEQGRKSGQYVYFRNCPVCGHDDCFRYYPATNSWFCWGASNTTGYKGGTALEYFKATRDDDDVEAVKWLRETTGHPYREDATDAPQAATEGDQGDVKVDLKLPKWERVQAVDPPKRNPSLVHGVLRRGHIGMLAGKGKSGKSWAAIELSIAVATGGEWFGWKCEQGRVLYIDPEIDRKSLDNRFAEVCDALGVDRSKLDGLVFKWSLRGVEKAGMQTIIHDLVVRGERFDLVIIDSASCFVDGDENKAHDLRRFEAKVHAVSYFTGAAVLLIHHYGKGNAGDRDAADRARGSSVWLDFPDAPLYLTEIFPAEGEPADYLDDGARAFILEAGGLREFANAQPKHVIFKHPAHRVDEAGITDGWKPRSSQGDGGKQTAKLNQARKEATHARLVSMLLSYCYREGVGLDGESRGDFL